MTMITIDLPDALAADLRTKAKTLNVSLDEVLQEAARQFILNDESGLEPLELTPEELAAVTAANEDLAAGRTMSHEHAMAHFRKALAR